METPLTPSVMPHDNQVGKLHERLLSAARKSGVAPAQFQAALSFPGTELEDEIAASITKFSKRALGIYTPVRAEETGLIPNGYTVESDDLEGDIDIGLYRMFKRIYQCQKNESLQSYLGLISHGNSYKLKQKVLNCYGLWEH